MLLIVKINDIKSDLICYNANVNAFKITIDDFNKHNNSIKGIVDNCKIQSTVLKKVYELIVDGDDTLAAMFKKLANNSSKAKEIHYPIKRKHDKRF